MVNVAESIDTQRPIRAVLEDGIASISANQVVTFQKYVKKVLPIDGFVFWLAGETISVAGGFHYASNTDQTEDETIAINSVIFNTTTPIFEFNSIDEQTLYIAHYDGIRFAFSKRGPFYEQAGVYHYEGNAVYSALATQLVENLYDLATYEPIVSNSLPAWLTIREYNPVWLQNNNPGIYLYPSYLVPFNIPPPYGVVHIEPSQTAAIQAAPKLTINSTHYQLAMDRVRITFYGLTNAQVMDFVDTVNQYTVDTDVLGIMNIPTVRDEKRPQSEIQAIAMKKTIEYDVSYYQQRIRDVARQLIEECIVDYSVSPYPTNF
jgi:hypothetical protein